MHTEIIQIGLQCATHYYIRVVVILENQEAKGVNLGQGKAHKRKCLLAVNRLCA